MRILATSREGLGFPGEILWRVPSLSLPEDIRHLARVEDLVLYDAVRLFVDRAVAIAPGFAITNENGPAVAHICQRLDGIPPGIELAAARVKVLAVEQIAVRLDDRFRLLTGGSRTLLPRQQTLRATLDWSYDLLSDEEQTVLRRSSVFAGGWTLDAAEVTCAGGGVDTSDVLDLLASLVDKSLVVAETQSGEARYRLLETVRQYGWARLVESNEAADIRRRHRDWYLEFAERGEPKFFGPEQVAWLERLETEYDNLRAALETSKAEDSFEAWLRLAGALHHFWFFRGYENEGRTWLKGALDASGTKSSGARAKALYGAGILAWIKDELAQARTLLQESLALFRELKNGSGVAYCLHQLAHVAEEQRDDGRATALFEESLTLCKQTGNRWGIGFTLSCLSFLTQRLGDIDRAKEMLLESLPICKGTGNMLAVAYILQHLGQIAEMQTDYKQARLLFEEALTVTRRVGNKRHIPLVKYDLAGLSLRVGDSRCATALYRECLVLHRERGDQSRLTDCLEGVGRAACAQRQYEHAARMFGAADLARQTLGFHRRASEQVDYERYVASTRAALGEKSFAAAWAVGRAMTLEQAIEYALAVEAN